MQIMCKTTHNMFKYAHLSIDILLILATYIIHEYHR